MKIASFVEVSWIVRTQPSADGDGVHDQRREGLVTLIVTVTGPESIWLLADRRLSSPRRPPRDDGRKVMLLETDDGVAILGYAGLGATARGTEPGDWMGAVLRGRRFPLEQSLGVLAQALQKELPRHMIRMLIGGAPSHHVMVPAFLGKEPMLYGIELVLAPDRKSYRFRYTRFEHHVRPGVAPRTPRVWAGGSGASYLVQDRRWVRNLLRVLRANDRGNASPHAVADYLAKLNNDVHLADNSVGPRCMVVWRFSKGGVHKGGGAHQCYTGTKRELDDMSLPSIVLGMDMNAIVQTMMPWMTKNMEALLVGEPAVEPDKDEINAALARLPDKPDEKLR